MLPIAHWTGCRSVSNLAGAAKNSRADRSACNAELTRRNALTTLVIGSGLIGSQVARILVERGEKPVLMDYAAQPQAIGQIVDLPR